MAISSLIHRRGFIASLILSLAALNVQAAAPLKVCLVSGSEEYKSEASLSEFQKHLEAKYNVVCTRAFGKDKGKEVPGIAALESADVMILFTRRITLPEDQVAVVKKFLAAGKGVVGVRTASHAFQNLPELDAEILGGSYKGHYPADELAQVTISVRAKEHPVLAGVKSFTTMAKMYKNATLAPDATQLLIGVSEANKEPLAWVRELPTGRVFYTSMGVPADFTNANFQQLLVNAVFWTGKRDVEKK